MSIFGSIGRFFFGGPSKTTSNTTSNQSYNGTQTQDPYAPAQPLIHDYINGVGGLYNGGTPQISPYEQSGYDALQRTTNGPGALDPAISANNDVVAGKYLTPDTNPYLADIAKRVGGGAMAAVNQTFGGAGRTGSGLSGLFAGQGVGNALTDFFGQQYNTERGYQQQAIGEAPQLESGRYLAPQALISAGQNISARPFDIAAQGAGVVGNIARLGGTTSTSATSTGQTSGTTIGQQGSQGMIPGILNSFSNKLFGTQL